MGEIYEQSKKVRIWLGEADENTAKVFALLRSIAPIFEDNCDVVDCVLELLVKIFGNTSATLVEEFVRRPWFSRRWILQEVKLAQQATVHCGNNTMPWPWLVSAFGVLESAAEKRRESFQLSDKAVESLRIVRTLTSSEGLHLLDWLWHSHASECSEPQDRILSLYGLLPTDKYGRAPFNNNSRWADIFRDHAVEFVRTGYGEGLLTHLVAFGPLSGIDTNAPSWVPNWSSYRQHLNFLADREKENPFFTKESSHANMENFYRPTLQGPDSEDGNGRAMQFTFPRIGQVQHAAVKMSANFDWRDVIQALSPLCSSSLPFINESCTNRLAFLMSEMFDLSMASGLLGDFTYEYKSTAERGPFSREEYPDVAIADLFNDLLECLRSLDVENYTWSSAQIRLLNATGHLLKSYSLFYVPAPFDAFGFGPQLLQVGDLVVPLSLSRAGGSSLMLYEHQIAIERRAIVLRLDDANDFKENDFTKRNPRARIVGSCFWCIKRPSGSRRDLSVYLV